MPLYLFEDTLTKEHVRLAYTMAEVPSCGDIITVGDHDYRRLPETDLHVDVGLVRWKYPYVSQSLPRNLDGCKTNRQGKPIIESRSHEANVAAKHGYERDY
jgi:hypothetical protein